MNDENELDMAVAAVKAQDPKPEQVAEAQQRVWAKLQAQTGAQPITACEGFQSQIPAFLSKDLSPAKTLLLEDHTKSCVACRKALWLARTPSVVQPPSIRQSPVWRQYLAAAAMFTVAISGGWYIYSELGFGGNPPRAVLASSEGRVYRLSGNKLVALVDGEELPQNDILRTGAGSRAMLRLGDGTLLEAGERSQLSLSGSREGTTVDLGSGNLLVQSNGRGGPFYVSSNDGRASVKGATSVFTRGTGGSRVAVLQGNVQWERNGVSSTLRPGEQAVSEALLDRIPVADQVAWSKNADQWRGLLSGLASVTIQGRPGFRSGTRLLDAVPDGAAVYITLPNLSGSLEQATAIIEDRVRKSPALQEWMAKDGRHLSELLEKARQVSSYLGEELVLAFLPDQGGILVAEVIKNGLREVLAQARIPASVGERRAAFGTPPLAAAAVLGGSHFATTPFGMRVQQAASQSTGIMIAADLQRLIAGTKRPEIMGLANLRYLIAGQRTDDTESQYSAILDFAGSRSGVASWLGAPSTIAGLAYVSPQAHVVAAAVSKRPADMIADLQTMMSKLPGAGLRLAELFGPQIVGSLGNEWTITLDGAVLPLPEWKVVVEVSQAAAMQSALEAVAAQSDQVHIDRQQVGPLLYYDVRLEGPGKPFHFTYLYTDGFLLAGANRAVIDRALLIRQSGMSLTSSSKFRALLPRSSRVNFSAMLYGTAGGLLGGGDNGIPATLVCAYGGDDRIEIASNTGVFDSVWRQLAELSFLRGTPGTGTSYR